MLTAYNYQIVQLLIRLNTTIPFDCTGIFHVQCGRIQNGEEKGKRASLYVSEILIGSKSGKVGVSMKNEPITLLLV